MADTPRVTVPVEPTEAMMRAWHRSAWPQGPEVSPMSQAGLAFKRHYAAMLSASPAPEGGAKHYGDPCVKCGVGHDDVHPGPCRGDGITISRERANALLGYLKNGRGPAGWPTTLWCEVQAFIANIETALAAPADHHERNLSMTNDELIEQALLSPPLEAPAEAGTLEWSRFKQMCEEKLSAAIRADHGDAPFPMDANEAASYHRTRADLLGWVLDMWPTAPLELRAQPPAREDAQPVAWERRWSRRGERKTKDHTPKGWNLYAVTRDKLLSDDEPLFAHPAPDALRVAVEALAELSNVGMVGRARQIAKDALAALQAEQKGGA